MTISTLVSISPVTLSSSSTKTHFRTSRVFPSSISPGGLSQNWTQSSRLFYPLRLNFTLYLKKMSSSLAGKSRTASKLLEEKAGPVEEFQWLGLMLFVAVPFPGTGAWTGAFSANLCGVLLAALLVNLLVNLGLKEAIVAGIALFFVSAFMWSVLRKRNCTSMGM